MRTYALRRLLLTIPTLFGLSVILFVLVRLIPGDAALLKMAGGDVTFNNPAALAELRHQMGLDRPIPVQFAVWLGGVIRGDLGQSVWSGRSVVTEIADRLPVTAELALGSIVLSLGIGVVVGVVAAVHQDHAADYVGRLFGVFGVSIPAFWVGTVVIVMPAVLWGYLPPLGFVSPADDLWGNLRQFIGPWLALGWALSASIMRITRSQMLEVLGQDYVRTARAKGLSELMMLARHALKNALIPIITIAGLQVGFLIGGTVVVETVFGLPGLGSLTLQAVMQRDYQLIQGTVLLLALAFVLINLIVDLSYGWLDPRIRYA
jgi:peptide/nickel transport system permease protein